MDVYPWCQLLEKFCSWKVCGRVLNFILGVLRGSTHCSLEMFWISVSFNYHSGFIDIIFRFGILIPKGHKKEALWWHTLSIILLSMDQISCWTTWEAYTDSPFKYTKELRVVSFMLEASSFEDIYNVLNKCNDSCTILSSPFGLIPSPSLSPWLIVAQFYPP